MKKLSLFTILIFFYSLSNAQDTIVKLNGDRIYCKITDVYPKEVKYKKVDSPDSTIYFASTANIKFVLYSNGTKQKFENEQSGNTLKIANNNQDNNAISENSIGKIEADGKGYWYKGNWIREHEMQTILLENNDQQITSLVNSAKKSQRKQRWGYAIIPLVLVGNIFMTNVTDPENKAKLFDATGASLCFSGAIAFGITTLYFRGRRKDSNREAIKLYNAKYLNSN